MNTQLEVISRITFLVIGTFHFLFNWSIFEINYFRQTYVWKMNINSAGEAHIEAIMMTLLIFPFITGLLYFINDFKQKWRKEQLNV